MAFEGIGRVDSDELPAGDLFVVAGFPEVEIGDTLADPDAARPLPAPHRRRAGAADDVRREHRADVGQGGPLRHVSAPPRTARARGARQRSIELADTESPDVLEVAGRGELQLAVLIESMRREGYELEVSRPEVITREIDGKQCEPLERGVVDVPEEHVGTVTQALAPAGAASSICVPAIPVASIVTFEAPARGLIGFRSLLMTATRGTALLHQHHGGWIPWAGELPHRQTGTMVADRAGASSGYALDNLQLRGTLFIGPGEEVYEGMVVGENSRAGDMMVNVTREKQKTNIRTHAADDAIKLDATGGAHARDRDRVHRRRRAGRGHARRDPNPQAGAARAGPPPPRPLTSLRQEETHGTLVRLGPGSGRRGARCLHSSSSPTAFPFKRRLVVGVRGRGLPEGSPKHSTELSRPVAAPGSGGPVVGQPLGSPPTSATTFIPCSSTPLISVGTTTGSRTRPCGPSTTTSSARPRYHRAWWDAYVRVNWRFADAVAEIAAPGAEVWVHDYHLQLVPSFVRERDQTSGSASSCTSRSRPLTSSLAFRGAARCSTGSQEPTWSASRRRGTRATSATQRRASADPTERSTCDGHSAASVSGSIRCRSTTRTGTTSRGSPKSRSASSSCVATSATRRGAARRRSARLHKGHRAPAPRVPRAPRRGSAHGARSSARPGRKPEP